MFFSLLSVQSLAGSTWRGGELRISLSRLHSVVRTERRLCCVLYDICGEFPVIAEQRCAISASETGAL